MNWEPVIIAWIVLLGVAILGIIAIQTAPRIHNAFRRLAQIMFCVLILALDVFAVIAEYYRINFLWSILFAPAVCMIVLLPFFLRQRGPGNHRPPARE